MINKLVSGILLVASFLTIAIIQRLLGIIYNDTLLRKQIGTFGTLNDTVSTIGECLTLLILTFLVLGSLWAIFWNFKYNSITRIMVGLIVANIVAIGGTNILISNLTYWVY